MILVAHHDPGIGSSWVQSLAARGHLAQAVDPASPPDRPTVLDALCVDPRCSALALESLRRWAGGTVPVRVSDEPPDDGWLNELVRTTRPELTVGGLPVDLRRGVVQRGEELVALTDIEALLLAWLATQAGAVISRADLLRNVWGYSPNMQTRVVDVTIARLRTKIERDPANPVCIVTVRGMGYRLDGLSVAAEPAPPTRDSGLIGRERAWSALHRAFERGDRLVTLLGPPGIGKTALALAFHDAVPGSIWCGLQPATTEEEALALLAEALDMPPGSSEERLRAAVLHGERPLLVLDNAEHLVGLVGRLSAAVPSSPVLITSRVRLGSVEERCLHLEPLDPADTELLFLRRARALRGDFAGTRDELSTLATLCEGLPLAVELAAAQVHVLSAPDLVRVLSRGGVRSAKRGGHKSYDDALASSWALLQPEERHLLALLAGIRGDAPVSLLEAVFDEPLEALSRLADASLVQIRHTPSGAVATLLETVRRHVHRVGPLAEPVLLGLLEGIVAHVTDLACRARGPEGWAAVRDLGRLRPAVWGAVEHAVALEQRELAAQLGLSLTHFYETIGPDTPDLAMLRRIGGEQPFPSAFAVAHLRALVSSRAGNPDEARRQAQRAAELASGPSERAATVYIDTVLSLRDRDTDPSALRAALDDLDEIGRYRAYGCLAVLHKIQLELDEAIVCFERALAIADRMGAGWMETNILGLLSSVYGNAGQWERAAATASTLVEKLDRAGFSRRSELSLQLQRVVRQGLGDLDGAIALQEELVALMASQGQLWHQGRLGTALALMHLDRGHPRAAVDAALKAIRCFQAAEDETGVGHASVALASAQLALGELDEARRLAESHLDNREAEARDLALEVLVYAAFRRDDPVAAAQALAVARPSEALGSLIEAVLCVVDGVPPSPPPAQAGRFGHRSAMGALLGGPPHEPRTDRERSVASGVLCGGPYPETALVALLHR